MNVVLLGVIAAAMFATLFLVYQTVEAEREQREQVRRTVEVLEELRQVSRSAISGETGQRGYLITLDRRYLAPYQAGREQIDPTLDRIRELIGEDATARQTELIDKIDALARAKFDEMATGVELLENGRLLDARRAILTDEGVETMERLDRAIAELEDIENETLAAYSADAARTNARVLPLLGALLVFLIIAMFAGARLVGRTLSEAYEEIIAELDSHRAELDELTTRVVESGLAIWAGDGAGGGQQGSLIVRGQAHLLEDVTAVADLEKIRALFTALETKEEMLKLLSLTDTAEGVQIFIGADNTLFNLAGCSMIVGPYNNAEETIIGAIGVIGPTRMNYAHIIPMVDYTSKLISRLLGQQS